MEIILVANGTETLFDGESFGVTEESSDTQILSAMRATLNEISNDVPFAVKEVNVASHVVGENGMEEVVTKKWYVFPQAPNGR
jgi:hypothetical protein